MKADIFEIILNYWQYRYCTLPLLPELVLQSCCAEGQQLEINYKITFLELNNTINVEVRDVDETTIKVLIPLFYKNK